MHVFEDPTQVKHEASHDNVVELLLVVLVVFEFVELLEVVEFSVVSC